MTNPLVPLRQALRSSHEAMPSLRTPQSLQADRGPRHIAAELLQLRALALPDQRSVTRVAKVQKRLLMLTRVRELARCLVACAQRKAERNRIQTVALQHATDTLDHVTVDTFDLTRLERARGQEHGSPRVPVGRPRHDLAAPSPQESRLVSLRRANRPKEDPRA
jgi:hypothetical protein